MVSINQSQPAEELLQAKIDFKYILFYCIHTSKPMDAKSNHQVVKTFDCSQVLNSMHKHIAL